MNKFVANDKDVLPFTLWTTHHAELGFPLHNDFGENNLEVKVSVRSVPLPNNHCFYRHKLYGSSRLYFVYFLECS